MRRRRRRSFVGQEWAARDTWLALVFATLLAAGVADPRFIGAAVLYLAGILGYVGLRVLRRRRAERANDGKPSWLDEMRRSSDS